MSLEALQIILRDEREMLLPIDKFPEARIDKLFPNGLCPKRLIEVVEKGKVWMGWDWSEFFFQMTVTNREEF